MMQYLVVTLGLLGSAAANYPTRPSVTLPAGPVIGTTTTLPSATVAVNKYLGIPFAASPPERFSPPEDPVPWSAPLDASASKPACIQAFQYPEVTANRTKELFNPPGGGTPPEESEDCLYLDVFAPSTPAPKGGRAILVWFFGGGLQFGTGSLSFYDGSSFATNQDVIVVSTNYRTNVFGFSNSPEIANGEQNAGFLDQRKTLQWVQENIASFGGDPTKVTIFGESAGGYSVKQLIAGNPAQDPLPFRGAIMQSEGTQVADGAANWATLAELADCTDAASQLACLRAVPADTLRTLVEVNALIFPAAFDNVTAFEDFRDAVHDGAAARNVSLLIGTDKAEGRALAYGWGVEGNATASKAYLDSVLPTATQETKDAVLEAYADVVDDAYLFAAALITDLQFQCPAAELAHFAATEAGYDVWRYYYEGAFENVQWWDDEPTAYHSSEISIVFGTYPTNGSTEQERKLSQYVQKAWADFAKDTEKGPGWPKLDAEKDEVVGVLGRKGEALEKTISVTEIDKICEIYAPVITAV